jgi:hypothetical protein
MAWARSTTTKHTHPVVFGRQVDGCPRCAELAAGAEPVRWAWAERTRCATPGCGGHVERGEYATLCRSCQIRAHNCTERGCGVICTAFDW